MKTDSVRKAAVHSCILCAVDVKHTHRSVVKPAGVWYTTSCLVTCHYMQMRACQAELEAAYALCTLLSLESLLDAITLSAHLVHDLLCKRAATKMADRSWK